MISNLLLVRDNLFINLMAKAFSVDSIFTGTKLFDIFQIVLGSFCPSRNDHRRTSC